MLRQKLPAHQKVLKHLTDLKRRKDLKHQKDPLILLDQLDRTNQWGYRPIYRKN
jgi:hypothetical protein